MKLIVSKPNHQRLLYRFLKENDMLYIDITYFRLQSVKSDNDLIRIFDSNIDWFESLQGYLFWWEVQCKFVLYCYKNNKLIPTVNEKKISEYAYNLIHRVNEENKPKNQTWFKDFYKLATHLL